MSNIDNEALHVPERKKHNWGQAVMLDCGFCNQWTLTVKHDDGGCICASCCDSEYTADLKVTLATAIERMEAAEKRIADLEQQFIKPLPIGELLQRLENQTGDPWRQKYLTEFEARQVALPTFDGYVPHVAEELQAAFRIACAGAGISIKGE